MFILIHGNPETGFDFYGPFPSEDDATSFGENSAELSGSVWWTVKLLEKVEEEGV